MRPACLVLLPAGLGLLLAMSAHAGPPSENDYPTVARSDYVLGCMAVNGGSRTALENCSCAIDVIASVLPFDRYEKAETVLRMRQLGGGYLASEFRTDTSDEMLRSLREAQAEAEVRCF